MKPRLMCLLMVVACGSESPGDGDAATADGGPMDTGGAGGSTAAGSGGQGGRATSTGGAGRGGVSGTAGGGSSDAGLSGGSGGSPDPSGPAVDRSNPDLHEFALDPTTLDPGAVDYIADQYAQLDTRTEPLGKLVFFLPGANNSPRDWRDHGRKLAEFGFHVVIPHYNNAWGDACSGQGGSCNTDTRWEALTGENTSTVVDISRADSAEGRVLAMLAHLSTAHPEGDWGYYLTEGGALRDEHVVIAGISHGATSTGLFASRRAFSRAVMHSGAYGQVGDAPATPLSEYYALSHTDDPQHDAHLSAFDAANLLGENTTIDGASPPYGGAHRLVTSEPNTYPHCSVVVHSSSPTDAEGNYLFEPAWRYMYGIDG